MFAAKQQVAEAVDRLIQLVSQHQRGDVIPHKAIEDAIGHPRQSGAYNSIFYKARRRTIPDTLKVVLVNVSGVGYRVATPQEQIFTVPQRSRRSAVRRLRYGQRSAETAPTEVLSGHQQNVRIAQVISLKKSQAEIRQQQRGLNLLMKTSKRRRAVTAA